MRCPNLGQIRSSRSSGPAIRVSQARIVALSWLPAKTSRRHFPHLQTTEEETAIHVAD